MCSKEIRNSKIEYEKNLSENIKTNSKSFWNYVRSKSKTKESVGNLEDAEGCIRTDNTERAEILNNFFASVFTQEDATDVPEFDSRTDHLLENIEILELTVEKYIKLLKPSKSQGPDSCHPKFLIETVNQIKEPLTHLFKKSLEEGKIPDQWRLANVIPIHKKGPKNKAENYRPISLTSVCCKVLEKIVRDKLVDHMESNKLFTKHQHGFRKGHSCVTQLIDVCEQWSEELDNKNSIDVVFLDFQKAFDSVPHKRLIRKLYGYGIRGTLLKWIEDFLSNRKQRVVVNGSASAWSNVSSGIPQGSVLGPTLFLIYINDLPDVVHSVVKLFADDAKIFSVVNNPQQALVLQTDIYNLVRWSIVWLLKFHHQKCKHMHFGRENDFSTYFMDRNNEAIITVSEEKDLGVTIDNQLKFVTHIHNSIKVANRNLGIIKRTFSYIDKDIFLNLYKSLVRPHLEYGSCVWTVMYKKDCIAIENVQRRATKLVKSIKNKSYTDRIRDLGIPSLQYRRIRADMVEVYRIINGIDYCDKDKLFTLQQSDRTRGHRFKMYKKKFRLDIRRYSFSQRVIDHWNKLPDSVVSAQSINMFKSRLNSHWKALAIKFDPDCYSYSYNPRQL
ncbi:MAG: reverse transcriptase family protein, partial [gamma proteobacterium symbiont of Lucinoma myriamae]|nr:reverse transcriptase family protein [gamma proteobacterium symbiont of Lucinoma myriamae]